MRTVWPIIRPKVINTRSFLAKTTRVPASRTLQTVWDFASILHPLRAQYQTNNSFFCIVAQHDTTLVDREETPRMPWHDMSVAVVRPPILGHERKTPCATHG